MNHPKVSIIILNWNGLKDTKECLQSLRKITYSNYEIIVVDNGSQGDDGQVLKKQFGDYIHLIQNDKNYGYTGGNNIGIRYALGSSQPDWFLLLNNDVTVDPEFLTEMVKVAQSDDTIGIAGPKTYMNNAPDRLWLVWASLNMRKGQASLVGLGQMDHGQYDEMREIDGYVGGFCLLIRQQVIQEIGLLDESYFCYWDETDYCFMAKRAGYKIAYAPRARIWHKKSVVLEPWYKRLRRRDQATVPLYRIYFMTRNNFKFMKKHATKGQYRSFFFYFFAYRFWVNIAVCLAYHRRPGELIAFLRGLRDGLLNSEAGAKIYMRD